MTVEPCLAISTGEVIRHRHEGLPGPRISHRQVP